MKVLVAVILAIGSVSALGSGPYLPSGWRPQGPAFYLPGEVQKPADSPLKETIIFENEASSSDSLQEYGPPKSQEISQDVVNQGLPDVVTEQTFLIVEDKGEISAVVVEERLSSEVSAEQKSELVQEETTEAQLAEEQATETYARIADIELQTDATTVSYTEVEAIKSEEIGATIATVEEKLEEVAVQEVEAVEEGVKNIAEALVNLENEVKAEQVQNEAVAEVKVNQEGSGSAQVPEGFLEYGPPGFREYGPPKGDELLKFTAVIEEPTNSVSLESNEARRRRFSPKFSFRYFGTVASTMITEN